MKKQLLKLTLLTAVLMSATTFQAQALWTVEGKYKISTAADVSPVLYMTINGSGELVWAEELAGNDPTQVWTVQSHRTPAGNGFIEIFANLEGIGPVSLTTTATEATHTHPDYTLSVKFEAPKTVAYTPPVDETPAVFSNDLSGLDQFQRRKTKVGADGLADPAGVNPADGNNALFIKTPWGGNSRYGTNVVPSAAGESILFSGTGIAVIQYHLVEANVASVNTFGLDEFIISNPVSNQLTIKGATSKVNKVSLYSVLGNKVMSKSLNNSNGDVNLNVSALSSGLYIVEMTGNNGERFTKKIIKQ